MEPIEYCSIYVKSPQPDERGYRAACVRALAQATFGFYSERSIDKNWGASFERRPENILQVLEMAHVMNSMHGALQQIQGALQQIQPSVATLLEQSSKVAPYIKHK